MSKEQEAFILAAFNTLAMCKNNMIVFLMEKKMKKKFLNEYGHDNQIFNEETAMCLEYLNNNNFLTDTDNDHNTDKTNSFLFIDFSIITFNGILSIMKDLYENKMAIVSKLVLESTANPNNSTSHQSIMH